MTQTPESDQPERESSLISHHISGEPFPIFHPISNASPVSPIIISKEDATEAMCVDPTGNVGIGTPSPSHPLHVNGNTGIRQDSLYMTGGPGWSSVTYNAYHNDANNNWVFPDPSHEAVTIEMDDSRGSTPRFEVWSTTKTAPTGWIQRFAIDGNTGNVFMAHNGGNVGVGLTNPRVEFHTLGRIATGLDFQSPGSITFFPPDGFAWFHIDNGPAGGRPIGTLRISQGNNPGDHVLMTLDQNGNVNVPGNFSVNGQKNFVQEHPSDPDKQIVFVSLEGDEAGTYTRGTWKLEEGKAIIDLPEHFGMVTSDDGLSIQLTPRGQWLQLYVVQLTTSQVIVQEAQGKSGQFDYFIQGLRKGHEHHEVIQKKDNIKNEE
jgi:hypothetical protein